MTFDDGIIEVFDVENASNPGEEPVQKLKYVGRHYFKEQTVGVIRFYEAIKAEQKIDKVIAIHRDESINTNQVVVPDVAPAQYRIRMAQAGEDEEGIKITKLSLERSGEQYEIVN